MKALSIYQLLSYTFLTSGMGALNEFLKEDNTKKYDAYTATFNQSEETSTAEIIGVDIISRSTITKISIPDKIKEMTLEGNNLWLSTDPWSMNEYGKNIYHYNTKENKVKKVAITKGMGASRIFIIGEFAVISINSSDSGNRSDSEKQQPDNSGIEIYKIETDNSLTFVKLIDLDPGHKFNRNLIATDPLKTNIYIASRALHKNDNGEASILYVINTNTFEIESKTNLDKNYGVAGGIAVSTKYIFISSFKKYPRSPDTDKEFEKIKDNRVLVFNRNTQSLTDEIQTSHYFPSQLIYNRNKDHLYALHQFRANRGIAIIDCKRKKETSVIEYEDGLYEMTLANSNSLLLLLKTYNKKKTSRH